MSDTRALVLEMLAESGIDGDGFDELVSCLTELDVYVDDTPPEPSPELVALIAGLTPDNVVPGPFGRRRARLFIAGAAALSAVGAGGIAAAAANELPSGAQTIVAEFSERFLPFELPHPDGSGVPHVEPTESDPTAPTEEEPLRRLATDEGAPATSPSAGTTTAPAVAAEPSSVPSATATTSPSVGAETGSASTSPSAPTGEPSPGEPSQESGAPQAGETTAPDSGETTAAEPSEPAAEPSGSPSPTANTRTEVTDAPSTTPSPSASASSSTSPSPTSSTSATSSPSTAVWSDTN